MSARIYESMTKLQVGRFTIRVWRTEPDSHGKRENSDIDSLGFRWADRLEQCLLTVQPEDLIDEFLELPRVAAVEVTNESGRGIVGYNDWP